MSKTQDLVRALKTDGFEVEKYRSNLMGTSHFVGMAGRRLGEIHHWRYPTLLLLFWPMGRPYVTLYDLDTSLTPEQERFNSIAIHYAEEIIVNQPGRFDYPFRAYP